MALRGLAEHVAWLRDLIAALARDERSRDPKVRDAARRRRYSAEEALREVFAEQLRGFRFDRQAGT